MTLPAIIEVTRGELVENVHHGVVAVANASGEVIYAQGDTSLVSFPRSALKPLQAVPLVESGAAKRFGLKPEDIALACASHHGEPMHIARVEAWLKALSLTEEALSCGPAMPYGAKPRRALTARGIGPARRFHNCSGKHCGFLTGIVAQGEPVEDYRDPSHPAQLRYLDVFSELLGSDASALPWGSDGCTLPAVALPLSDMAIAAARLSAARSPNTRRADAMREVLDAFVAHPEWTSGTDELASRLVAASDGACLFKTGADGYAIVYFPKAGLGAALKVTDGDGRARDALVIAVCAALGEIDANAASAVHAGIVGPVRNSIGESVGEVRVRLDPH